MNSKRVEMKSEKEEGEQMDSNLTVKRRNDPTAHFSAAGSASLDIWRRRFNNPKKLLDIHPDLKHTTW